MSYFSLDYIRGFVLQHLCYEYDINIVETAKEIWDEHAARNAITMARHIPLADVPAYYCQDIKGYNGEDRDRILNVYRFAKRRLGHPVKYTFC
ncbi:hypothetical protein CL634_00290 [bacterium]|nr:hypothetical protein [bacterium]